MKSKVKKKSIEITLAIMIMISLLTGCGERAEENRAEEVKEPETENVQTDEWTENPDETGQELQMNCDDAEEMILLARIIYHNPDETSRVEREYEYDSLGNRTRELIYHSDVIEWREWEYDAFGSLVKEKEYTPISSVVEWPEEYWREMEYDSSGNLTKETWYDFDGGINDWKEYEYDVSGNPTKMLYYATDGNVKYQEEWEYDEFGNRIMESHSTLNGTNWIEWEYDSPENPTHETETHYDWDGNVYIRRERTYAPTGSLTWEIFYWYNEDGSILRGEECEYDSFGNKITEISYGENGSIISRREYDSSENPTKETATDYNVNGNVKGSGWMEWEHDEYGNCTKEIWYKPDGSIGYWREFEYITLVVISEEDLYDKFLNGEQCVGDADIYYFITPTGEPDRRYGTDYIIMDSTGDGIPELHLRTAREYTIFSYVDDELVIIQSFFSSPWRYNVTKKGVFVYREDTGTTLGDYYLYFEMDIYGNFLYEVSFEWTDINENLICDENDEFIYDNCPCTKEEWCELTKEYLFIDEEGRYQIRDQVEWIRYCDSV